LSTSHFSWWKASAVERGSMFAGTPEAFGNCIGLRSASGRSSGYATDIVRRKDGDGETSAENVNAEPDAADLAVALDRLEACAPMVGSVSLVVAWFGDDLRAGHCRIRPGVEVSAKSTTPENWSVDGVARASAHLVSRDDQGRPAYDGTPSDSAVVQAIQELKARGYRVTFYPFSRSTSSDCASVRTTFRVPMAPPSALAIYAIGVATSTFPNPRAGTMPSVRESRLSALHALLQTQPAPVLRGEVLPEILRTVWPRTPSASR
jgi:hypothetical protein